MSPGLNIAALSKRTGVPADTLRKWEQRYGALQPKRTSGGQRRYSEFDVARVEWLQARIVEGYRIGEAAALLGSGEPVGIAGPDLSRAIVEATTRGDVVALEAHVAQAMTLQSIDEAFLQVLAPALVEIGTRWEAGELTIAQEHLASSVVRAALQKLLADPRGDLLGVAVLACAQGERHEIGLLMLAVLLRADGWQVAYLGPDTPAGEAVALAGEVNAAALCFSATSAEVADELERELATLDLPDELRVIVGGRASGDHDIRQTVAELREHVR